MFKTLRNIIIESRPRQWIKNAAIYTALLFSTELTDISKLRVVTATFIIFCLISSATYFVNDIVDRERDKEHPSKKNRPIASGELRLGTAVTMAILLFASGIIAAYTISGYLTALVILYIVVTLSYSFLLKEVAIIESIMIALGFVIRVLAGSIVVNIPISSWLMVSTISLALLISFGRRKAEITLMGFKNAAIHRPVLERYPKKYLEVMISSLVATTFLSYVMFTFSYEINSPLHEISEKLFPDTLQQPKWLMLTIPAAFYGISRYLYLIYNKREKGEPEKIVTQDMPFFLTMVIWSIMVLLIIYFPSDIIK